MQHLKLKQAVTKMTAKKAMSTCVLLCLLLLFTQTSTLVHHHADDSIRQIDCQLCLKLASADHAIAMTPFELIRSTVVMEFESADSTFFHTARIHFQSRAPPAFA